jgi:glycine cleavage system regulatory protein
MPASLVITIIGPDRPGLVESVSRAISDRGGNWTRSRMAHLAGQFAGILHVTIDPQAADDLKAALEQLAGESLSVTIARDDVAPVVPSPGLTLKLDLIGQDRPGIVREISRALAARGVNVEELATECESAPWSGEILFKAQATLHAPADTDLDTLRRDLEAIAQDLMVEISLVRPI